MTRYRSVYLKCYKDEIILPVKQLLNSWGHVQLHRQFSPSNRLEMVSWAHPLAIAMNHATYGWFNLQNRIWDPKSWDFVSGGRSLGWMIDCNNWTRETLNIEINSSVKMTSLWPSMCCRDQHQKMLIWCISNHGRMHWEWINMYYRSSQNAYKIGWLLPSLEWLPYFEHVNTISFKHIFLGVRSYIHN